MHDGLVSVIIPTYNRSGFIRKAIESVLAQTYRKFEIIVVDDGSTDNTRAVLDRYVTDGKILYHTKPNAGHAAALNTGIGLSHGPYVAFLDSDDWWLQKKLELQMEAFQRNPNTVLVHTNITYCNEQGENLGTLFAQAKPYRGYVLLPLFENNFISLSSAVVRKACVVGAGLFDEKNFRADDYDLWLRLAVDYPFDYVDTPLVQYLRHANNLTNDRSKNFRYLARMYRRLLRNRPICRRIGRKKIFWEMARAHRRWFAAVTGG